MERDEIIKGLYYIKNWKCNGDAEMYEIIASAIRLLEQPELIAQDAYVRGFEQGRAQGKVDANLQSEEAIPIS